MTVLELNLRTGDRIQEGDRFGTFLGADYDKSNGYTTYYKVQWDWDSGPTRYSHAQKVQWVALPRPVPTLASLKLKVGDCFNWDGENWIVIKVNCGVLECRGGGDVLIRLQLNRSAEEFKKLEVPK